MLCQFSFENFKAFKDETTLDMFAEKISEHTDSQIVDTNDGEKLLPIAAIYGPNGGGKSTVLEAFWFLIVSVVLPVAFLRLKKDEPFGKDVQKSMHHYRTMGRNKFFKYDAKHAEKPIRFNILFRTAGLQYKYEIAFLEADIVEENLYAKNLSSDEMEIVFERNKSDYYLGKSLDKAPLDNVKTTMPFLSHFAINYNYSIIDNVVSWMCACSNFDYNNPFLERQVSLPDDDLEMDLFLTMLREMDLNIESLRTEEDDEGEIEEIYVRHTLEDGTCQEIPFDEESSGTKKLFSLLPRLINCLGEGGVAIADELDAKLHPKLLKYIIELFTNRKINKRGAQLIFTSHDMCTMTPEVLRRDEIWFSTLGCDLSAKLYSLVEFKKENGTKVRPDEAYSKRYIEGHYGADPYIKRILNWDDANEQ